MIDRASERHATHQKRRTLPVPPSLCRWSVHCSRDQLVYDLDEDAAIAGLDLRDRQGEDPADQSTWKDWPSEWNDRSFPHCLVEGIATNRFSTINGSDLPVALPEVFQREEATKALGTEALGFAIMAGSPYLVEQILKNNGLFSKETSEIHAFDPTTSYLDGSKACCLILGSLCASSLQRLALPNRLDHSPFDNLMLTILRSNTSLAPDMVDSAFRGQKRFPGEEVDICGRWDAGSECYRQLLELGMPSVPLEWKHKFCHTSIQVICYSIRMLVGKWPRFLASESGLFVRHCDNCGLKLKLSPLHILILIILSLVEYGFQDEDRFGMLAVPFVFYRRVQPCSRAIGRVICIHVTGFPFRIYFQVFVDGENVATDCCYHERERC